MDELNVTKINHQIIFLFISITMISSGFVLFEPAPYEFFIAICFGLAFFCHYFHFHSIHFWPFVWLLSFLMWSGFSFYFVIGLTVGILYFSITCYLAVCWLGLAGLNYYFQSSWHNYIFTGYLVSAILSTLFGVLAYNDLISFPEVFLQFGRMKGLMKDPNVFGAFLVPPTLFCFWKMNESALSSSKRWLYAGLFLFLSVGILLSFSRAVWGQYMLTIFLYLCLIRKHIIKRFKIVFILGLIAFPLLFYVINLTGSHDLFLNRLGLQAYDDTRFSNQANAAEYVYQYPLGTGPGQSELYLDISTHSLYIRILYENGLLALISFCGFYLFCLWRAWSLIQSPNKQIHGYAVLITACLIGILFNSFFIDTLHWRHMWLLLALPFMNRKE